VPTAPDLGGAKHATAAAHVSKGTLARARGTATRNTGNTSNSATSAPRNGRGLVTGVLGHSVGLASVLGHQLVHVVHNIRADGGREDSRQLHAITCNAFALVILSVKVVDVYERPAHF
jgi:hypothetical protein